MTAPIRYVHQISGDRTVVVEIPPSGDVLTLAVEPATPGPHLPLTSSDALLVGLALERAAVLVGQREAARRDRETAKRDRARLRKLLGVRDPARRL